jgi:hypothetical protein
MERSSGIKVIASTYNQNVNNQQYISPRLARWIQNGCAKLASVFETTSKKSSCLPQHNNFCSSSTSSTSQSTLSPPQNLHLLSCMHRNRVRKILQQDRIEAVKTDRALICYMRKQYACHRGHLLNVFGLKSVTGIFLVRFRLPLGGSVDVRDHDPCCTENKACECIPPLDKVEPSPGAEYRCIPGPPATYPPIPPEYLSMLFSCPSYTHEADTWILDQLPKRTCGVLQGKAGQPAEGWGIYYQEGWDRDLITVAVFLVFVLASLLFGVLWSRFQYDVQGAFGVSAYMITAGGILIALLASWAEKIG